ncbi:YT521-B-like domain-containing protein [Colletotrichum cereale]|nr:YT521-B-like domain-containing protein [Colletotrichum cereale]
MGDVQSPSGAPEYPIVDSHQGSNATGVSPLYLDEKPGMEAQGIPCAQHQQYGPPQHHAFSSQLDMAQQPATGRPGAFNMNGMANALPQAAMRHNPYASGGQQQHQQQRFSPAASSPSMMPQMPQMAPQYPGQAAMPMGNPHYYMPQHPQMQHYYANQLSPTQQPTRPNMGYYPNQMIMNHPQSGHMSQGYYYPPAGHYGQSQTIQNSMVSAQYMGGNATHSDPRGMPQVSNGFDLNSTHVSSSHKPSEMDDGRSGIVRGPPRKPRQSGHAIWIGNLPPQTDLMHLVHHVCKEANGLESLFLISKSNCAFANFKDEHTCMMAQQKLHDSKFQSVRLVSRLRKSTVEGATGVTAPTGPAASSGSQTPHDATPQLPDKENATEDVTPETNEAKPVTTAVDMISQKDKFFILKSLTVEDLELSVRTGIWATQSHNEETLNAAFNAVDNVYLVFSANKSGEYFGYARMTSQINEDPDAAIEFAPKAQSADDVDLPKAIPTEPTEFAPKGRIIDDSARGTIFWEAEREEGESGDEEEEQEVDQSDVSSRKSGNQEADGATKAWGKPFKLEWLSTARLPFYRTRGLRNPWNSNREVKIARDGTELEPSVGRRLIGLFNRVQSPGPGSVPAAMRPGVAMVAGYPPMRPQYQQ